MSKWEKDSSLPSPESISNPKYFQNIFGQNETREEAETYLDQLRSISQNDANLIDLYAIQGCSINRIAIQRLTNSHTIKRQMLIAQIRLIAAIHRDDIEHRIQDMINPQGITNHFAEKIVKMFLFEGKSAEQINDELHRGNLIAITEPLKNNLNIIGLSYPTAKSNFRKGLNI